MEDEMMIKFSEHSHLLAEARREARAEAFAKAVEIMGKGPEWFDRYRELLAKMNEAKAAEGAGDDERK